MFPALDSELKQEVGTLPSRGESQKCGARCEGSFPDCSPQRPYVHLPSSRTEEAFLSQALADPYEDFMFHHLQYYGYFKGNPIFSNFSFLGIRK